MSTRLSGISGGVVSALDSVVLASDGLGAGSLGVERLSESFDRNSGIGGSLCDRFVCVATGKCPPCVCRPNDAYGGCPTGSEMARRILITGASGLLGRECYRLFAEDSQWESLGLALSRAGGQTNLRKVDLTNSEQLSAVVKEFKPSVILHSAAERNPDKVEKEEEHTKRLNVIATQHISSLAKEVGAYVLFVSTDYVFDGTKPPYKPTDSPNPLNKYGQSKADGEKAVIQASPENIVLRVPILYGNIETIDESAVTVLFPKLKDTTSKVEINHLQRRYPTSCADVARAIKVIVDSKFKNSEVSGFFHCSSPEMMTKYDMAMAIAEVFGLSTTHIVADTKDSPGAPRPFDCKMDTSKLTELGFSCMTPFKEGIREALKGFCD